MAQILVLKIASDGVPQEHDNANDDLTFGSYTVTGGGPVLNANLDMNNGNISDANDLSFTDPTTDGITVTSGTHAADKIMFEDEENSMDVGSSVLFPVITDVADSVDAFRLPALAGVPTASPGDGGEGYLVWDSTNDHLYAWDGAAWDNLSTVDSAESIDNFYTADEALSARDAVYISAADNVSKASGASVALSRSIGFATAAAIDTASVPVRSEGILGGFSGLTAGAPQYLDPATAGAITETLPVGSGNVIVQMGYAKSATAVHIQIDRLGRRA
jgi:hypothetical protein